MKELTLATSLPLLNASDFSSGYHGPPQPMVSNPQNGWQNGTAVCFCLEGGSESQLAGIRYKVNQLILRLTAGRLSQTRPSHRWLCRFQRNDLPLAP
jgi:hypothetical protein